MIKVNAIIGLFVILTATQTARADINVHINAATVLLTQFVQGSRNVKNSSIMISTNSGGRGKTMVLTMCPELIKAAEGDAPTALDGIYETIMAAKTLDRLVQIEGRAISQTDKKVEGVCLSSVSLIIKTEDVVSQ